MIKSKKQMFIVIGAFTLVMLLVGTTYAFFNYTRTGAQNTVGTGSIYFLATESNERINITNFFPTATGAQPDSSNSDSMTIAIEAGTSYQYGIDYSLKAVDVSIPSGVNIPVKVTTSAVNDTGKDIGFTGVTGVTLANEVSLGEGHVAPSTDGGLSGNRETGTITVTAYIDAASVAISDTYDENNPGSAANGTTSSWVNERRVITTSEWNALASNPITFKVKVEAGEGELSVPTIASCPGCKFMYTTNLYGYGGANNPEATLVSTLTGVTTDYTTLNSDHFIGFTESDGKIDRAFACGIKGEDPNQGTAFCVEGKKNSASAHADNGTILFNIYGSYDNVTRLGCSLFGDSLTYCDGALDASTSSSGQVEVKIGNSAGCNVQSSGNLHCWAP